MEDDIFINNNFVDNILHKIMYYDNPCANSCTLRIISLNAWVWLNIQLKCTLYVILKQKVFQ